ncbi:dnaJ homolog subfamily C member 5G-like isoform X2 [Mustelus asterias]
MFTYTFHQHRSTHLEEVPMANRHERTMSVTAESLYRILDLPKKSSPEDVEEAYRKLALRYHPDNNPDNPEAAQRFQEINRAKDILSDEKKKQVYDSYGSAGLQMFEKDGDNFLASQNNCCMKLCARFCTIITCCFSCCSCCGKCLPKVDPNDWNPNIAAGASNPILHQPGTRETSPLNREYDQNYSTMN